MRTSGAATETRLTLAMGAIALGVIVLLAGGPSSFLIACEQALRSVAESIYQGWLTFRG